MTSITVTSFRCNEKGCKFTVTGDDADELMDCLNVHKHSKHNMLNLGRLPNEILVNIFRYVVPKCVRCFPQRQREILRLGSVSKRFNELTKVAELYKGINLTCGHGSTESFKVLNDRRAVNIVYRRKFY